MFEITGYSTAGRVALKRMSLASAVRKAQELLRDHTEVQIKGPDGQIYLPKDFDYL